MIINIMEKLLYNDNILQNNIKISTKYVKYIIIYKIFYKV